MPKTGENMQAIKEMHDLIKRLMSRRNPTYSHAMEQKSPQGKLLKLIVKDQDISDQDAADLLHSGQADNSKRLNSLRSSKYKLFNRLMNALLFLNICHRSYSEYLVNMYSTKKELVVAELLMWFQSHSAMRTIALRVQKKAARYHLTREELRSIEILKYHASIHGPKQDCLAYANRVEDLLEILNAEVKASNLKTRIRAELTEQLAIDPANIKAMVGEVVQLQDDVNKYQSRSLWHDLSVVGSLVYRHSGDFDKAFQIYEDYLNFLDENTHLRYNSEVAQICYSALRCCLIMRDYSRAQYLADLGIKHQQIGTLSWFMHQTLHIILNLHLKEWTNAFELFRWGLAQKGFKKDPLRVEVWTVLEGYLRLFSSAENVMALNVTVHGASFHINRLLQEVDVVRKDKAGLNISILIFQVLYRLRERQFDLFESRIKALDNYIYKNLHNDGYGRFWRTETLFKFFIAVVQCQYDMRQIRERTEATFQQLSTHHCPDTFGSMQIEEIVPYEHIWERVLHELEQIEQEGVFVKQYRTASKEALPNTVNTKDSSVKAPVED